MAIQLTNGLLIIIFIFLATFAASAYLMWYDSRKAKKAIINGLLLSLAVSAVIYFITNYM
ncbi:MAG: hypothetical protein JW791_05310 [Nanoarchaeota archaeon]|nr:hypothetical protein [Nanoarchaeota archaeon]